MHALALALLTLATTAKTKPQAAAPAQARAYDVGHYAIALDLDTGSGGFTSRTAITLTPGAPLKVIELDVRGLEITAAKLGGAELAYTTMTNKDGNGVLTLPLPEAADPGKPLTLEITAKGSALAGGDLGLLRAEDPTHPGRTVYYTSFEPEGARRVFPCNDIPADKATSEVSVTVDAASDVISNGVRTEDVPVEGEPKRHRVTWKQDKPHSTYLIAVAVGPFVGVPVPNASVKSAVHVAPEDKALVGFAGDAARAGLTFFSEFLGTPYPWDKYDQVAIPEFLSGGMENTSATFLRASRIVRPVDALADRSSEAELVSHELAHQWFGDDVTCASWRDLWLNEAFATFLGRVGANDFLHSDAPFIAASIDKRDHYFQYEEGASSRPIQSNATTSADAFDAAAYQKGAAVLRMLESQLGRDVFRKGLKTYLAGHAFGSASTDDFFAAMQSASGKDLTAFKKAWILDSGYPVLKVSRRWLPDQNQLAITVEQRANKGKSRVFPAQLTVVAHRTAEPAYHLEIPIILDQAQVTAGSPLPAEPEWLDWNLGDVVLARIEANEKVETLTAEALKDTDPMARLWAQLELAGPLADPEHRSGPAPSDAALQALAQAIHSDHSPYVRAAVLDELARGGARKLPLALVATVMAQATGPEGLPEDQVGISAVRRAGYGLLGKIDDPTAAALLEKAIGDTKASLDLVEGAAMGLAHRGDAKAVGLLKTALEQQGNRGFLYREAILRALASAESESVLPELLSQARASRTSSELLTVIARSLRDNRMLVRSNAGVAAVGELAAEDSFSTEIRARFLHLLDDVKTPAAKAQLVRVAKLPDERLSAVARQTLQRNFGAK